MAKRSTRQAAKRIPLLLPKNQAAVIMAVTDAVRRLQPSAFFLTGPWGTGKSTVLTILAELAVTEGHKPEIDFDPREARLRALGVKRVFEERSIACCSVSLTDKSEQSLQAAIEKSIQGSYPRVLPQDVSLVGDPQAIKAGLPLDNRDMLLILVDDLSSFLNTKEPAAAANDLLFLQSLGELISAGGLPVVIIVAVQENISVLDSVPFDFTVRFAARFRVLSLHIEGALSNSYSSENLDPWEPTQYPPYEARLQASIAYYEQENSRRPGTVWLSDNLAYARMTLAEHRQLLEAARRAYSEHSYDEAIELYDRILTRDFGNDEARRGRERAQEVKYLIGDGERALSDKRYLDAYRGLSRAFDLDTTNAELRARRDATRDAAIVDLTSRAESAESNGDYSEARRCFTTILSIAPERKDIAARLKAIADRSTKKREHRQQKPQLQEALSDDYPGSYAEGMEGELGDNSLSAIFYDISEACDAPDLDFDPADPSRNLARLVGRYCDSGEVDLYLQSKGIQGKTMEARVLELCVKDDPLEVVRNLITAGQSLRLAENLGLPAKGQQPIESVREGLLLKLGFLLPRKPVGVRAYRDRASQLRARLKLSDEKSEVIGIGLEGCDDIGERVLKDLIHFYCTELMGPDYQRQLAEQAFLPADSRPGIDSLTFGKKIGLIERINGHIKGNPDLRQRMRSWFGRDWIIDNARHVQKYLNPVSSRRSHLAHPEGRDDEQLKQEAGEALDLLGEFFQQLEEQMIYPPVVVVEARRIDRFGRLTYECVDDRGCPERVFTALELKAGVEYFLYPITNPIRVDPIIVEKQ